MRFDDASVAHRYADLPGVRLHYVEAGEGPLVVLLHGFPEHWYGWRHQIPALAAAGFRVVAPDLRGYNLSGRPRRVRDYGPGPLAADVAALIAACGAERAHVVGHDWGAGVAWLFAMAHPERLERLAVLNGPHPERLRRAFGTLRQLKKSWYMFFFQIPWLPEAIARSGDFAWLRRTLARDPIRRDAFDEDDIARYVEAASRPGGLTGAINYYRAAFRESATLARIDAPVLVIWGERDRYLGAELAEPDLRWVPDVRIERVDASHWVQHDRPEEVSRLLIEFFRG